MMASGDVAILTRFLVFGASLGGRFVSDSTL